MGATLLCHKRMGHSQGNNVTSGYQDMYPLETRFKYNSKLLNVNDDGDNIDVDSMSPEQMKALLKKMLGQTNL